MAKSTADTVFNAKSLAAKEWIWLLKVQTELYCANYTKNKNLTIKLYNDNQASVTSPMNGKFWASTRHFGVCYFWLKEIIETAEAEIGYLRTDKIVPDGLTKALDKTRYNLFVSMLGMY